ncbi:multidrug ABC transporter [Virgibacillus pantothenticus]|uniref:Acriflavin resistance protein n=1 Tax=Virgibacillus pantothenticus TaxID=1473 RepID=A0A0L0QSR4_VIRPA|nr:efflux RND transporter permease subunit [Virgibacillus pantothenticus]KNE21567.1 acriflavin resistance protein [Virgibacillus pantothenticus]MED3736220.1 efflux RND transporter permease subunit [Virgibacillus pantothenticus]QTY16008.1 efflux RND transporter permease subunit [Virgibacillus pantothenticus]SIS73528.1 hydrophobic/amphiphilic exporter-1, HAE1 family [Virgibacillus pantothenticus]GIP63636.1 multidrug ABC transporter [Virgibacillus pantothenticus]
MKLIKTSVKRPVGVIMIVLAILALGAVSLRSLTVDLFPKIDLPVAVVATSYQDAAPQEVENLISRPIESAVSTVEGIETVQSQSQSGSSLVVLMFNNGTDLDQALLDVRESVDQVKDLLPSQAGDPNIMRFNPDQLPVMWVGLTGENAASLTKTADEQVVPFLERQGGVGSVNVEGGKEREIQLILDEAKLQQYGATAQTIMQSLTSTNQSASVGTVEKGDKDLQLRVTGEFESIDDIKQTIVQTESGATVHVDDLAEVKDDFKEQSGMTLVNGKPSVVLSILKKTDSNTVEVATNIEDSLQEIKQDLPSDVNLDIIIDTSDFIQMSIDSVVQNILIGGAISIFILLLFLKSIRATIVIGLSIPIAIITTFILMYFTGETLNILTLGGLALGLGMMVDSSIVILEHIYSYRQRGYSLKDAAIKGASELAPAVIASTTTTLVVFLPIIYVEGIASDMFTPLALAVSFSLITSLVVAITLVPMLSSKLLQKAMQDGGKRYWFDRFLGWLNTKYQKALKWVLGHRKTTVFVTVVAIVGSLALTPFIGAEFIPSADQGQLEIRVETDPGSSLKHTEEIVEQVNKELEPFESLIETNYVSVGGGDMVAGSSGSGNQAVYTMQLIPSTEREKTTIQVVQEIDDKLQGIAGAEITVNSMDSGMNMGDPIQVQLNGPEHEVLRDISEQVVREIEQIDGIYNPETSASEGVPQMNIEVNQEQAAMYGLNQEQVLGQIQMQFTGQVATQFRENGQEMDVTLMYPEEQRSKIEDLHDMKIQTPQGATISLDELAEFKQMSGPVSLQRENQQPQMNVSSQIVDRDLGTITQDVEKTLAGMELPEGYNYEIGGQAQDMTESFTELAIALVFSIFLVYAVMAVQFENFLFPLIVMFAMPTTVIGVMLGLFIVGIPLSIPAFIGIIMLAGIVVNNSIVLVDYINLLRRKGMERYAAILEAGPSRLRPILMTTLTTILAMIPLAMALGEGAEMQQPLAVTIIFGLGISSIFTLLLIPVIYTLFDDLTAKMAKRNNKKKDA